ncbi:MULTISPECIES: cell division ATP-binding protein FtsE [unclassified Marinobacter]|jgi:cell division transport system ATP-binding protein|uniref:cell division ATP-binding protein FtsE n=1 Tax=unclassified Marinobacter TaxID=83889 RepID=UPI00200D19AA|nr:MULTISPECIES: cell division ATP-binding protein FtsE [unclassified Marinobacter]MCL1477705.1 cell division ATP-binding protein FtsE [Marinobacter sp.]MCL1482242.1 cell division ATP-binding protein FtsE [Marinobacter sp.]MCL1485785.1 cell division ATP-binding protein FtsE [Marinobacter sp.]UQG55777.1 cell division ATP-binding protein FtsE [Marinobacter sp. M4C]UQG64581.1 cell division ATP-binding protein FtsE [Marinobacter sp. M2C]
MIEFRQVTKRYGSDHTALRQVNFALNRGELAFLTGHSGAGKSTLLKLLMVMERPSAGEVWVGGQLLNSLPRRQIPYIRRHIGVVFQNHQLLFDRTVFDNVAMPLQVIGVAPGDIGRRVRAALDKVGLLSKEKMNPLQLSGGEQQRVGIARAVVNKPPVLLADEPTGNLDPELSADIMNLFGQFSQVGVTVLIASHDITLINDMNRRTLRLDQGQLVADGRPRTEVNHG